MPLVPSSKRIGLLQHRGWSTPQGIEYDFGVGYGLTHGSDHLIVKLNLELERFVGAIFKASSDKGWSF